MSRCYRKDYQPYPYNVKNCFLDFHLSPEETNVRNRMIIERRGTPGTTVSDLILNADELKLHSILLNKTPLEENVHYTKGTVPDEPDSLVIRADTIACLAKNDPTFEVTVINSNTPRTNLQLQGLYCSQGLLITHNEPHGFRRITYYIDRPDNMAIFEVSLSADKNDYPTLLCNGDLIETHDHEDGRHTATFYDPFPKGPHLFAIVAGKLSMVSTHYTTGRGDLVKIEVYSPFNYRDQLRWALQCAVKAMVWDEKTFGRYYDLKTFRIVAAPDFNMGAMENKSLNIFNVATICASPDRSTGPRFRSILGVIGHEYFHNWSGNRVNVRDWFQITLKEGFTRFRDQLFTEDTYSDVERIGSIRNLRARQFVEDAGPGSHSIQPDSYVTVDNFYTATLYEKGAAVIRGYRHLLGPELFRRACDYYFERYDGQAISCDEFRRAMEHISGRDLSQYMRWYRYKRTPTVRVEKFERQGNEYHLTLRQVLPADANTEGGELEPLLIPIGYGFVPTYVSGLVESTDLPSGILELKDWVQEFVIKAVTVDVVPSLLRNMSAPVILEPYLSESELLTLMRSDTDTFNRWEAAQSIYHNIIVKRAEEITGGKKETPLEPLLFSIVAEILDHADHQPGLAALMLSLPGTSEVCIRTKGLSPYNVALALKSIKREICDEKHSALMNAHQRLLAKTPDVEDMADAQTMGEQSLRCVLLDYISHGSDEKSAIAYLNEVYENCKGKLLFTDTYTSARLIISSSSVNNNEVSEDLYKKLKDMNDENALDQWFTLHASSSRDDALDMCKKLTDHPDFKGSTTPNRLRSLVSVFGTNPTAFHDPSSRGYVWFGEQLLKWDKFNPHIAAVSAKTLTCFTQFDESTQQRMRDVCTFIMQNPSGISTQLREILEPAVAPQA